jgi:hypothetical protein
MDSLPVEILSKIFSYLSFSELLTVSETCQIFHAVTNAKKFMNKICVNFTKCDNFKKSTRSFINLKIEHVKDEELGKCIKVLSQFCPTISSSVLRLKIEDVEISDAALISRLIICFDNLIELHFEGIYLKTAPLNITTLELPKLKIVKFFYSTNCLLQLLINVRNQLDTFKICLVPHDDEFDRNRNYQLVSLILQNNKNKLKKLNFYEVNFDDLFLEKISVIKFTQLCKLSMSFNSNLSKKSLGFKKFLIQQVDTLEKFKIRTFDHISQHQLKLLIENAVNIKSLNIIICSSCDYEKFTNFKNLHNLETLKIQPTTYCDVENSCYKKFLEDKILDHKNLRMKHLTINMLPISREIADKITFSFPNLVLFESLNSQIEPDAIKALKEKNGSLRKIVIDDRII